MKHFSACTILSTSSNKKVFAAGSVTTDAYGDIRCAATSSKKQDLPKPFNQHDKLPNRRQPKKSCRLSKVTIIVGNLEFKCLQTHIESDNKSSWKSS